MTAPASNGQSVNNMDEIKMNPVISSNLSAAGYDEKTETLKVRFKNGTEYQYAGVPKWVYTGIFTAESPGKFVRTHLIKSTRYKSTKLSKK